MDISSSELTLRGGVVPPQDQSSEALGCCVVVIADSTWACCDECLSTVGQFGTVAPELMKLLSSVCSWLCRPCHPSCWSSPMHKQSCSVGAGPAYTPWCRRRYRLFLLWWLLYNNVPPSLRSVLPLPLSARASYSLCNPLSPVFPRCISARRLRLNWRQEVCEKDWNCCTRPQKDRMSIRLRGTSTGHDFDEVVVDGVAVLRNLEPTVAH